MPDIAMCLDYNCSKRQKCYRYVTRPTPDRQTYADFKEEKEGEGCKNFSETGRLISQRQLIMVDNRNKERDLNA